MAHHFRISTKGVRQMVQWSRNFSISSRRLDGESFDVKMLEVLVCPLSKAPLRYDAEKSELVCDELGVAYPIKNGIPNLVPTDARRLEEPKGPSSQQTDSATS